MYNVILFSRAEVTNLIHSKHELELKKVFSKEVSRQAWSCLRLGLVFRLGLVVDKTWFNIFASKLLSHERLKCVHVCCLAWLELQLLSASVDLKLVVPKRKLCLMKDLMLLKIISQIKLSLL